MTTDLDEHGWACQEFHRADLDDQRLTQRLVQMATQAARTPSGAITAVFRTAAEREGAFRFVGPADIGENKVACCRSDSLCGRMALLKCVRLASQAPACSASARRQASMPPAPAPAAASAPARPGPADEHEKECGRTISSSETGNRLALAAAMLPVFGLRAGEALSRRVRDIDRGRIWQLYIDEGLAGREQTERLKTESSRRRLEIPPLFIPLLERLVADRSPQEYLFGATRTGQRIHHQRLWSTVRRLCQKAGVPIVCPHSMRGYYASAGVRSGALPHVVAANMGHSSFAMTAYHYAQPQAIAGAHSARVLQMLDLGQSATGMSTPSVEQLLEALPAATLARIAWLITQRTASLPTAGPDGRKFRT